MTGAAPPRFATPPDALIEWPAAFGRRFIVTVDTEEEFDWSRPLSASERRVDAIAALPDMHRRFAARGVHPAYLVDHPVASDPAAAAVLRGLAADDPATEIGAQLHGWVTPPYAGEAAPVSFAGSLPAAEEAAKLDSLVAAIVAAFGRRPRLFRAGRYGIGPATAGLLAKRGFRADASMRARFDYRDEGGPDFTRVSAGAFRLGHGLIELPLTTVYTGAVAATGERLHPLLGRVPHGRGVFARARLLSRVPLTPEGTPAHEAARAVETSARAGERLLQLSFHSPSLVPGNTPYVRTAADLQRFHDWWSRVFDALARGGYQPATIAEVLAAACADAPPRLTAAAASGSGAVR